MEVGTSGTRLQLVARHRSDSLNERSLQRRENAAGFANVNHGLQSIFQCRLNFAGTTAIHIQFTERQKTMSGKFSGIVNGGGGNFDNIFDGWDEVQSADDFGTPIPAGKYVCIWRKGELTASKKGTPSYKLTLEVESGDHAGRKVWFDIWLTAASRTIAKRDFEKLGITNPREQLKQPIPKWLRLQVTVGLQADDSGIERNSVLAFKVLERIQPEADPFAPESEGGR